MQTGSRDEQMFLANIARIGEALKQIHDDLRRIAAALESAGEARTRPGVGEPDELDPAPQTHAALDAMTREELGDA